MFKNIYFSIILFVICVLISFISFNTIELFDNKIFQSNNLNNHNGNILYDPLLKIDNIELNNKKFDNYSYNFNFNLDNLNGKNINSSYKPFDNNLKYNYDYNIIYNINKNSDDESSIDEDIDKDYFIGKNKKKNKIKKFKFKNKLFKTNNLVTNNVLNNKLINLKKDIINNTNIKINKSKKVNFNNFMKYQNDINDKIDKMDNDLKFSKILPNDISDKLNTLYPDKLYEQKFNLYNITDRMILTENELNNNINTTKDNIYGNISNMNNDLNIKINNIKNNFKEQENTVNWIKEHYDPDKVNNLNNEIINLKNTLNKLSSN